MIAQRLAAGLAGVLLGAGGGWWFATSTEPTEPTEPTVLPAPTSPAHPAAQRALAATRCVENDSSPEVTEKRAALDALQQQIEEARSYETTHVGEPLDWPDDTPPRTSRAPGTRRR